MGLGHGVVLVGGDFLKRLLGSFQNQFEERKSGSDIVDIPGFHSDVDELQECVGLFDGQFNFNHAARTLATAVFYATKTGFGTHGNGFATTGGLIWF